MKPKRLNIFILSFTAIAALFAAGPAFSEKVGYVLEGKVLNSDTSKPVDFANVVIPEAKKKTGTDASGYYFITVPEKGEYTVIIQSEGMKLLKTRIAVSSNMSRDFRLVPVSSSRPGEITIVGQRDLQKVSRQTITQKDIKNAPASYNDSIAALTTLPGVVRAGGDMFGPLIIRGGDYLGVNYFVDGLPIYSPMHFGGFHSVINTNFLSEVDMYASAFPAQFGSATSAVIDFNTVDEVKKFGGYSDINLLSATALIQTPILKDSLGNILFDTPAGKKTEKMTNSGYIIASGRRAYFDIFVAPFFKLTGNKINAVPNYYDYQFKAKYYFNKSHSVTVLLLGSKDYIQYVDKDYKEELKSGRDPLWIGAQVNYNKQFHTQGLYYTFQPSENLTNTLTLFSSEMHSVQSLNLPLVNPGSGFSGLGIDSKPSIFGAKEKFKWQIIKSHLEVRAGVEATAYDFRAKGKSIAQSGTDINNNIADQSIYQSIYIDNRIINYTVGGYVETKISAAGFTFVPGVRTDYLYRSGESTLDPRGVLSYEFPTKTTLSVAGGKYSYLFQTNPFLFDVYPTVCKVGKELESTKAIHRVAGVEQTLGMFTGKIEGFYNTFWDVPQLYYHYTWDGKILPGMSSGKIKTYGAEVMLRKDIKENENGIFGWLSYTYTRSRFRSGLPPYAPPSIAGTNQVGDYFGRSWLNYYFEQNHALKLVAGYVIGKHTISAKVQLYSSLPFTPIVSSQQDTSNPSLTRNTPIDGRPNSRHYPVDYRIDLRYSKKTNYVWGYITWYIEVINATNHIPVNRQRWDYRIPYVPGKNPKIKRADTPFGLFPNFGVEVKF